MSAPFYRSVITSSLLMVLRHPFLWFVGFLAAFFGGAGEYEFLLSLYNNTSEFGLRSGSNAISLLGVMSESAFSIFSNAASVVSAQNTLAIFGFLIIVFLIVCIVFSSQGGLVWSAWRLSNNEKASFLDSMKQGFLAVWTILAIIFATRLLALFVFAVVGLPVLAILIVFNFFSVVQSSILVLYIIAVPVFILFSLIGKYAIAFRMVCGYKFKESLSSGMKLLSENWLVSIEMAFLLFVSVLAGGIIFVLCMLFIAIPFVIFGIILGQLTLLGFQALLIFGVGFLLSALFLFGGFLTAFQFGAWTKLFIKIKGDSCQAKVMRVFSGLAEKYGK